MEKIQGRCCCGNCFRVASPLVVLVATWILAIFSGVLSNWLLLWAFAMSFFFLSGFLLLPSFSRRKSWQMYQEPSTVTDNTSPGASPGLDIDVLPLVSSLFARKAASAKCEFSSNDPKRLKASQPSETIRLEQSIVLHEKQTLSSSRFTDEEKIEGYLLQRITRVGSLLVIWKRRWCVASGDFFFLYKTQRHAGPKHDICAKFDLQLTAAAPPLGRFFSINTEGGEKTFRARTEADARSWYKNLTELKQRRNAGGGGVGNGNAQRA